MKAVLDIIILCVIILCVYLGYRKGFVKTVMSFLSFIIAFAAAKKFGPPLSSYLYSGWIKPNFVAAAADRIEKFLSPNINLSALVQVPDPPENFVGMLKGYGVSVPDVGKWINEAASAGVPDIKKHVAANLAEPVAIGISDFLAFAVVFAAVLIALKIITALINKAVKLPGLNMMNKIGGTLLGGAYGMALSYIFALLVYYALPYIAANTPLGISRAVIDETIFFNWFLNNTFFNFI